jgi:hypothetical protein
MGLYQKAKDNGFFQLDSIPVLVYELIFCIIYTYMYASDSCLSNSITNSKTNALFVLIVAFHASSFIVIVTRMVIKWYYDDISKNDPDTIMPDISDFFNEMTKVCYPEGCWYMSNVIAFIAILFYGIVMIGASVLYIAMMIIVPLIYEHFANYGNNNYQCILNVCIVVMVEVYAPIILCLIYAVSYCCFKACCVNCCKDETTNYPQLKSDSMTESQPTRTTSNVSNV